MNFKKILLLALALLIFVGVLVPSVLYRHNFESSTKTYVAAVDVTRLQWFFDNSQIKDVLKDYKDSGCTTALFAEKKSEYNIEHIKIAKELGYNIALAPDMASMDDADIDAVCEEFDVKYIKLQHSVWYRARSAPLKSGYVCKAIEKHGITLVLTESVMQLGNEQPRRYDDYLQAANGKVMRSFNTYYKTNVDEMDYPAGYYQMYNSAYDRNSRFITVKQLEDKGFDEFENAERTQQNVKLFCQKMDSHGFVNEGEIDYTGYTPNKRVIYAATAFLAVLMVAIMLMLLTGNKIKHIELLGIGLGALAFLASFVMPSSILGLYSTLFAALAPCFCIAVVVWFVNVCKQKLKFLPLVLLTALISIALFFACGAVVAATLSGSEFYLNNEYFRGVKLSLVAPIGFAALLIFMSFYKKRSVAEYKQMAKDLVKQIRWYHIAGAALFLAVAAIYVIRSGNVNKISFTETYIRNWLTENVAARPRTKEVLIGWPCLALYVYYAKSQKSKILMWGFGLGASILFASAINTFCHVFTMTTTMFMRVVTGFIFGLPLVIVALILNCLLLWFLKLVNRAKKS